MTEDRARSVSPAAVPAGMEALADLLGGESSRSKRFLGGLVAGALVGAALAGTSYLRRRAPRSVTGADRP
jgi:hypothetical protein